VLYFSNFDALISLVIVAHSHAFLILPVALPRPGRVFKKVRYTWLCKPSCSNLRRSRPTSTIIRKSCPRRCCNGKTQQLKGRVETSRQYRRFRKANIHGGRKSECRDPDTRKSLRSAHQCMTPPIQRRYTDTITVTMQEESFSKLLKKSELTSKQLICI
jgi:hypothetical protein